MICSVSIDYTESKIHVLFCDIFKIKKYIKKKDPQQEDTTSSSETSPGSMTRKPKSSYLSRTKPGKSTQNLAKRHVRSSSGYSSHNEETTFRFDFDDSFHFALKFIN